MGMIMYEMFRENIFGGNVYVSPSFLVCARLTTFVHAHS